MNLIEHVAYIYHLRGTLVFGTCLATLCFLLHVPADGSINDTITFGMLR